MSSNNASKKEWLTRLLVLGVAILLVCIRFYQELDTTRGMVISQHGDGYKAYTVIQYHVKNDSTYSHFEGMNYPYGDHIIPSACQPLVSNTLKFINNNIAEVPTWTIIPIINYSMVFSFVLCMFFVFLILRKFELPAWYSLLVSIGVCFLTPQTMRMAGHYGLAHPEVVPVVLYLLMLYAEKESWKISLWMMFAVFFYSSIHFYYFAIMTFTIAFYFLFKFLDEWDWSKVPKYAMHFGVMLIIPFVFFSIWTHDSSVIDRSDQPWGFFAYRSFLEGVFTTPKLPLYQWIDKNVIDIRSMNLENVNYVGIVGGVFFIIFFFKWLGSGFRKAFIRLETKQVFANHLVYAAIAILIFSLGIPFIIPGLENFLDYTGPVQQFRSIGRFAWTFYYIMNILAFTTLYYWAKAKGTTFSKVIMAIALLVLGVEAYQFTNSKSFKPKEIPAITEDHSFKKETGIDFDKYQSILPVPYYNIGSDMFWLGIYGFGAQHSLSLSLQENLPTSAAMLTRTSRNQTFNQIQLVSEPYRAPKILDDYPNTKPLLLMWDITNKDNSLEEEYGHLKEGATIVGEYKDQVRFYTLPLTSFSYRLAKRKREIGLTLEAKDSLLYPVGQFYATDSIQNFVYRDFDNQQSDRIYLGKGGFKGVMKEENLLFDGHLPQQKKELYKMAFWMYMDVDRYNRADVFVQEYDAQNNELLQEWKGGLHKRIWTFDTNGWGMFELKFTPKSENSKIKIFIKEKELGSKPIWIDELLIRPVSVDIYKESDTYIWKNNRHFLK
jgi:hypothetical protein